MKIAWTTTETLEQAKTLARKTVEARLAACAQISGPITSIYRWKDRLEESTEYRITFKCLEAQLNTLRSLVLEEHPYDTPQWVAADLTDVSDDYREWAEAGIS